MPRSRNAKDAKKNSKRQDPSRRRQHDRRARPGAGTGSGAAVSVPAHAGRDGQEWWGDHPGDDHRPSPRDHLGGGRDHRDLRDPQLPSGAEEHSRANASVSAREAQQIGAARAPRRIPQLNGWGVLVMHTFSIK